MADSYNRSVSVHSGKNFNTVTTTDISKIGNNSYSFTSSRRELNNGGLMRIALIMLLFFTLGNVFFSGSDESPVFTFSSLLTVLQNSPTLPFSLSIDMLTISGDWGAFNFLKQFINWNLQPLSFFIFIIGNLINILSFLTYFLFYIF